MDRVFISLVLDLTGDAPEGPGWYIQAVGDGQHLIRPMEISPDGALTLAGAFQSALQTTRGELPQITPIQLVQSGNGRIRAALETQLQVAEAQAARVATLRRKLATAPTLAQANPPSSDKVDR